MTNDPVAVVADTYGKLLDCCGHLLREDLRTDVLLPQIAEIDSPFDPELWTSGSGATHLRDAMRMLASCATSLPTETQLALRERLLAILTKYINDTRRNRALQGKVVLERERLEPFVRDCASIDSLSLPPQFRRAVELLLSYVKEHAIDLVKSQKIHYNELNYPRSVWIRRPADSDRDGSTLPSIVLVFDSPTPGASVAWSAFINAITARGVLYVRLRAMANCTFACTRQTGPEQEWIQLLQFADMREEQ